MRIYIAWLVCVVTAFGTTAARAEESAGGNWPAWRGPGRDGRSAERGVPERWSATENVKWKAAIPGKGHSSPIVWGERIFLTTCTEKERKRMLLCLDRKDGRVVWEREVLAAPLERKHSLNNYASSTPATDGKYVWVAVLENPTVWAVCYDVEGNEVWRRSPGEFKSMHGWASAVTLYKDTIILNCDQDGEGYLVALDKSTGEQRWRTARPNNTRSYCNPLIVEAGGKTQMVLTGSKCTASYDPDTGKLHWMVDGPTEQFVASPVYADGTFFITGGFPTFHVMGISPEGKVLWHEKAGAYVPSPVAVGKNVYMVTDEGQGWCIEAKTGRRVWSQKLGKHHRPSPVYADGKVYFLADDGVMHVVRAGEKFESVAKNSVGEDCFASPAISRGQIFIRTVGSLFCIGE